MFPMTVKRWKVFEFCVWLIHRFDPESKCNKLFTWSTAWGGGSTEWGGGSKLFFFTPVTFWGRPIVEEPPVCHEQCEVALCAVRSVWPHDLNNTNHFLSPPLGGVAITSSIATSCVTCVVSVTAGILLNGNRKTDKHGKGLTLLRLMVLQTHRSLIRIYATLIVTYGVTWSLHFLITIQEEKLFVCFLTNNRYFYLLYLQCTVLQSTALHCKALQSTAKHCKTLHCNAMQSKAKQRKEKQSTALQGHCIALQSSAHFSFLFFILNRSLRNLLCVCQCVSRHPIIPAWQGERWGFREPQHCTAVVTALPNLSQLGCISF